MTLDLLTIITMAFSTELKTKVGPEDDFFDLGGDSLASENVLTEITAQTGVTLPGWALMDFPRAIDLAAYIASLDQQSPP
jgi:acyl carrier protein